MRARDGEYRIVDVLVRGGRSSAMVLPSSRAPALMAAAACFDVDELLEDPDDDRVDAFLLSSTQPFQPLGDFVGNPTDG